MEQTSYPESVFESPILKKMDTVYAQAVTLNQAFWTQADIDTRFKAGDQSLWNDYYGNLPAFRNRAFYFNRIRRVCNMVTGYQRRNRKSIVAIPVENSDDKTAAQISKVMFHVQHNSGLLEKVSDAFESGAVTTGMSLLSLSLDYTDDPVNGDLKAASIPYNAFLIDPYFTRTDLSDCNFVWRRQWCSVQQAMNLMPMYADDIANMTPKGQTDGKFQFMAQSYNYGIQNLMYMDEYWYRDFRVQDVLLDTQTGEIMEVTQNKEVVERFMFTYPHVIKQRRSIPTVKLAIVLQGRVMYDGPNPMGIDAFPFVPVLGYYEPEIPYMPYRCQGIVRDLRDAQYLYNRRKVIELDILESQINSGWIYKKDAPVDMKDLWLSGQGRGIALNDDAEMTDVMKIPAPAIPPTLLELSRILGAEIQEISGVNEELLGASDDDASGILSMLRQGAGLTTLQKLYDQLDTSQKLCGNLIWDIVRKNWGPQKIARIIGEMPTQEFFTKTFGKYDMRIEDGINTATQQQMQFAQLLQLRQLGVPVPDEVLVRSVTVENKDELIEAITGQTQQAQQQLQEEKEAQIALLRAQIGNLEAQAVANEGLGVERMSRLQENRALAIERIAESRKDQRLGELHFAQALKELQELDLNQILKSIEVLKAVQEFASPPIEEEIRMRGNVAEPVSPRS